MRVLIIGSGGREHAMAASLATAQDVELFAAPGNVGTASLGRNFDVAATDLSGLFDLVRAARIDLVVPGPEAPLCAGLADRLDVPCCGPTAAAAALEGSKAFMRELTASLGVPGPFARVVRDAAGLARAVASFAAPPVLKADGLCGGKGVFLPATFAECLAQGEALLSGQLGPAGRTLVVEERLIGVEASLFFACHGESLLALPHARDHKRACDGDCGPNTGGMGAVSPNGAVSPAVVEEVAAQIVRPTLAELSRRGTPFVGFLFVGLMLTDAGPRLLEFNVRLGDPEAQAILPRLADGEFLRLCLATATGGPGGLALRLDPRPTCAVVLTAAGYPESPELGAEIRLEPGLFTRDRWFIHAGTEVRAGKLVVSGGRVGAVVARAETAEEARNQAYDGIRHIAGHGLTYRRDIGGTVVFNPQEKRDAHLAKSPPRQHHRRLGV